VLTKLIQTLADGLAVGSLYALIALGYTMVYGILKFINFAHSDIFVLGAWVSFVVARAAGWGGAGAAPVPWWGGALVLVGAMAACGAPARAKCASRASSRAGKPARPSLSVREKSDSIPPACHGTLRELTTPA